jgi:hypothetical protein
MRNEVAIPSTISFPKWRWDAWTEPEPKRTDSIKEKLLRASLDLVRGKSKNEEVCREVVERALEAGLFDIVFDAMQTFSPYSGIWLCFAIEDLYIPMQYWKHFTEEFTRDCEQRVLRIQLSRTGLRWGDHVADQRSVALGLLARYRFFKGQPNLALKLWNAADDQMDVDGVIAGMCEEIVERDSDHMDAALNLLTLIQNRNIKAWPALAKMRSVDWYKGGRIFLGIGFGDS